jgi:hypothetical protein
VFPGELQVGVLQRGRLRAGAGVGLDELPHGGVGEQPATGDDHQVVGGERHLAHQVAGDQHRAALGGQVPQELAEPADPCGVKPAGRLVQQQDRRVTQQRRGDAEPLGHAEREAAGPVPGHALQADQLEDLRHPRRGDPVALRQPQQVVVGAAAAVHGLGLQQGADPPQWVGQPPVGLAVDEGLARAGVVEAEDDPHGGGLAGAVGAQEPGDAARFDLERQPVHGQGRPVALGQLAHLDHGRDTATRWAPAPRTSARNRRCARGRTASSAAARDPTRG